jgi:hypothetical protein
MENEPVPYQPTRQYTEFVEFEIEEVEVDELEPKVKYSVILQEEEYEEVDEDFFRDK